MRDDRVLATIRTLEERGIKFDHIKTKDGSDQYTTETPDYILEITINPKKWLGLVFVWQYDNRAKSLEYSIDSDLYPIANPDQHEFAQGIETDILNFVKALYDNKILVGRIKKKPAIAIPVDGGFYTVTKGWLWTVGRVWTDKEFHKIQSDLVPFKNVGVDEKSR